MKPRLTLIAAMDENRLIATSRDLPWHLPRDIAHFRAYTRHKWLLLGARTYAQMLGWFRNGHMPLVLTRRRDWKPDIGLAVGTVEEALQRTAAAGVPELVCVGGGQVFAEALPHADRMILTTVRHQFAPDEGAVFFPEWNENGWEVEEKEDYAEDSENPFSMVISVWRKIQE